MNSVFIPLLLGTPREGRKSEHVARLLEQEIQARSDITTQFFDVREFKFPRDGYGQDIKELFSEYREAIVRSDGLLLVTPEYNHSFPGSLKSVLDLLLKEYNHRAVGIASVSGGRFGGARVIESLLPVVRELGLVVSSKDLNVMNVGDAFDDDGNLSDESLKDHIHPFLDELVWLSHALRYGRENLD